jgi:hypothetical protein
MPCGLLELSVRGHGKGWTGRADLRGDATAEVVVALHAVLGRGRSLLARPHAIARVVAGACDRTPDQGQAPWVAGARALRRATGIGPPFGRHDAREARGRQQQVHLTTRAAVLRGDGVDLAGVAVPASGRASARLIGKPASGVAVREAVAELRRFIDCRRRACGRDQAGQRSGNDDEAPGRTFHVPIMSRRSTLGRLSGGVLLAHTSVAIVAYEGAAP